MYGFSRMVFDSLSMLTASPIRKNSSTGRSSTFGSSDNVKKWRLTSVCMTDNRFPPILLKNSVGDVASSILARPPLVGAGMPCHFQGVTRIDRREDA